ncbi:MAG: Gfo/Idh/MocA family oxidoreductase [Gemmatimonadales bacterium]
MTAPLPVGVVGVGALGRHHARHLSQLDDVTLVGVCDTDRGRSLEVAAEFGTRSFTDLDDMLHEVEAVTVAVPTPVHAEVGLRALDRGVPVLMEKPLTDSLGSADALIAMAGTRGVQLQVGHIERYNRAVRAAEPYLDGPRYIESQRLAPFQPRGTDVAVVLDLMIHDLDLVLHLTGGAEAVEVRASGLSLLSAHLDLANARVEFANGAVALATASRVSRERVRKLRLFQPNGYFSLDLATGAGEFMRVRPGWQPGTGEALSDVVERITLEAPEADALGLELQSFVHAVRGERDVVVRGEEGRAALVLALRVADAVRASPLGASAAG